MYAKEDTNFKKLIGLHYVKANVGIKSLHHRMSNVMMEIFEMEMAAIETVNFNPTLLALLLSPVNAPYS